MDNLLFKDEAFAIQGAIFEVYREIGTGFLEAVYQECLAREFARMNIPFTAHHELFLSYKGLPLSQTYKPDFICFGEIIVELKAVQELAPIHRAQVLNYLKVSKFRLGLLVNFCAYPKARVERIIS